MKFSSARVTASCAISALAAPPNRRDEWQPSNSTVSFPEGAPVPAPTEHPNTGWQPQGNQTCIYITNNYEWKGYGINLCNAAGVCCDKLPDGLSGKVLSAGPSESQVCFLYGGEYCTGMISDPITNPGYSNLRDIGFDNVAKSWKCFKMWPAEDPESASSSEAPTITSSSSVVVSEPVSVSTTVSFAKQTITPGSNPRSRPSATSEAVSSRQASISISTVTFTVETMAPVTTPTSTTAMPSSVPTDTSLPLTVTTASTNSVGLGPCLTVVRLTTLSINDKPGSTGFMTTLFPGASWCASATFVSTTAPFASSTPAAFSFDPISPTIVTHTFADGTITTTAL